MQEDFRPGTGPDGRGAGSAGGDPPSGSGDAGERRDQAPRPPRGDGGHDEAIAISVVAPMYDESQNVEQFFARLLPVLEALGEPYEVVCVDDGSDDDTVRRLLSQRERDPAVKIVALARNFGKELALTAGIDFAQGRAVVPIDADLQDPPELINDLVAKWREGYDVVYATRSVRKGESWIKRLTASMFYRVFNRFSDHPIPRNTGDFRLMDRRAVDALRRCRESTRFMKGLFAWVGFRQVGVEYERDPRYAGRTKWNYWRLWNFAIGGMVAHGSGLLKISTYVGLVVASAAVVYGAVLALRKIIFGADLPGYTSLMVGILFLGGAQLITLGIIGEYIGRVYSEVKHRPLYLIREVFGAGPGSPTEARRGWDPPRAPKAESE
jgi:glycosyltransferase involved in cell wall biosynthesis